MHQAHSFLLILLISTFSINLIDKLQLQVKGVSCLTCCPQTMFSSEGSIALSILASGPSCPRFDFQHSREKKIILVAEVYQWRWLEESGQWLENVDQTHLVLASGKPALQKNPSSKNKRNKWMTNTGPRSAA